MMVAAVIVRLLLAVIFLRAALHKLRDYNTFVRQFPNSIWAGIAGFQVNNAFFTASAAAKNAPAVKF